MRLLLYNIRYGLGLGSALHWPLPGMGYLFGNRSNLQRITDFIKSQDPDIVGLVEVDTGSIRTRSVNQADVIARSLGHYSVYQCKYGIASLNQRLPILRKQGNAFLAAPRVHGERFHYFEKGIKRLIIELELEELRRVPRAPVAEVSASAYAAAALARSRGGVPKARHHRRGFQYVLGRPGDLPVHEGVQACAAPTSSGLPSYPSRSPRKELDFVSVWRRHQT